MPAVWIGTEPEESAVLSLTPDIHHEQVIRRQLRSGIDIRVRRDGTFLFDFSHWKLVPLVEIPGYSSLEQSDLNRNSAKTALAEAKAEGYSSLRAQLMEVHQACLATSEKQLKNRVSAIGLPVTALNTYKGIRFDSVIPYSDDVEDIRALAQNVLNNKDKYQERNRYRVVFLS